MATSTKPRPNINIPRALWLLSPEYKKTEQFTILLDRLEDMFGYVRLEQTSYDCERFIRDTHGNPQYEQVFFIINIEFLSEILVQNIHDVRVVQSIFIFNPTQKTTSVSYSKFSKVHAKIYSDPEDLVLSVWNDVNQFSEKWHIPLSAMSESFAQRTTNIVNNIADYSELWYPLFIDLLFDLPPTSDLVYREELKHFADQCRCFYAHNEIYLNQINNFINSSHSGYKSSSAIKYYTADTFLYRRVNKTLRQQNLAAIFDFKFLLHHIHAQLQEAYKEFSAKYDPADILTFYRGQVLLIHELEALKQKRREGSLITVNSFFSTSMSRNVALRYVQGVKNESLLGVIMEINAEYKTPDRSYRKPFAYIGHLSAFRAQEEEVLFSIASFFRIDSIEFNENEQLWIVKMTFIFDEDQFTITEDYDALKKCTVEQKLLKVANLLSHNVQHSKTDQMNPLYQHFLTKDYSTSIKTACLIGMGWYSLKQKQYENAVRYIEEALGKCEHAENEPNLNYLYVMCYCCLGCLHRERKDYANALNSYMKAHERDKTVIPIDKYALYNAFNQIASINLASIYKLTGNVHAAWDMFKEILTYQADASNTLHSAVYLAISEAGLLDILNSRNLSLMSEWSDQWKAFFDLSFHEVSGNYRQCIVSGAISMAHLLGDNERTFDDAIICCRKVIEISKKFFKVSTVYYANIIQCYQQLARIYRLKRKYRLAIDSASEITKICRADDTQAFHDCYRNLVDTYEAQFKELQTTPSPDIIKIKLCEDTLPFSSQESTSAENMFQYDYGEFSFGQFRNALDSNMISQNKIEHCLVYCCLKLAALNHTQNNEVKARKLLDRAIQILPNDVQVRFIYDTNVLYLDGQFFKLIDLYEAKLEQRRQQTRDFCIEEDLFCYLAHLNKMMNNAEKEYDWYINTVCYFECNQHFCKHTRRCFMKLASYYRDKSDLSSCISIYRRFIHYSLEYNNIECNLQRSIVQIVELGIDEMGNDEQVVFNIVEHLIRLVLKQPTDLIYIDQEFRKIIVLCKTNRRHLRIVAQVYEYYVELMSKRTILSPYAETAMWSFLETALNYQLIDNPLAAIGVYQCFMEIILKHMDDREYIISQLFPLAVSVEEFNNELNPILKVYDELCAFIYKYPAQIKFKDEDLVAYIANRWKLLGARFSESEIFIHRKITQMLKYYYDEVNYEANRSDFLQLISYYYKRRAIIDTTSVVDSFVNLLGLYLKYDSKTFQDIESEVVLLVENRPVELLEILMKVNIDYLPVIISIHESLTRKEGNFDEIPRCRSEYINFAVDSCKKKYLSASLAKTPVVKEQYWLDLMCFLLDLHSQHDEILSNCHLKLGNLNQAIDTFDATIYNNIAPIYCSQAVQRYKRIQDLVSSRVHDTNGLQSNS